jgi:hypothetical protein
VTRDREQELCNCVDDADFLRTEVDRKEVPIQLRGFAIGVVEDVCAVEAEAGGLAIAHEACKGF